MDSLRLWARDGEAVRQAIELGEIAPIETASDELPDAFLLFAIESGLLQTWAEAFPAPRREPEIGMEVILPAHMAARFAGLYAMRKAGYVLRSARVLGALGYSVEVIEPAQGLSGRGTSDDTLCSGEVVRQLWVQMEQQADLSQAARRLPPRSPVWRAKGGSAPRAGPSSRPWMQLPPRRERSRARRSWSPGTTSMLAARWGSMPAWGGDDGCTFSIRLTWRWP